MYRLLKAIPTPKRKNTSVHTKKETTTTTPNNEAQGRRYLALQTITVIMKIIAVLVFLAGICATFYLVINGPYAEPIKNLLSGIIALFGSLIAAIIFWAMAELINCIMDIEYNTRNYTENEE